MAAIVAGLEKWYDWKRLVTGFGGWDPLIDAYVDGTLPAEACAVLEETDAGLARVEVQLLRRLARRLDVPAE